MPVKIVIADCSWNATDIEREQFPEDWILEAYQCKTEEDLIETCQDAEGILVEYAPVTRRVLEQLKHCRIVSVASTGYDNVDAAAAQELGIAVANVPNYCTEEVADHTLALILSAWRQIVPYDASVRKQQWDMTSAPPMARLSGKILGLVGFGHIAQAVALRAQAFGLQVITHSSVPEALLQERNVRRVCLEELLGTVDIISSHIPYTEKTAGFFNRERFDKMKQKPLFVNTSRGKIVNETDLINALREGSVRGAALDVLGSEPPDFNNPLLRMDQVIVTPHVAYFSEEALKELRLRSARNLADFLQGNTDKVDLVKV